MRKHLLLSLLAAVAFVPAVYAQNALDYEATPPNGSTRELPDGHAVTITFDFPNAETVGIAPWDGNDAETAGIRVTYAGESVAHVSNAMSEAGWSTVDNYDDPYYEIRVSKDIFTINGVLKIQADAGAFTVDGAPSPAIDYSLKFGEAKTYDYVLSPASNPDGMDALETFTVEFPTAETAEFVDGSYIVLMGPRVRQIYEVEKVEDATRPTFAITFTPAPDLGGSYTLTIDEGSFILDGTYQSPAITRSYILKRSTEVDLSCNPSPEGDKVVAEDWGTYVAFTFNEDETLEYLEGWKSKVRVLFDGEEMPEAYRKISHTSGAESNYLMVDIEGSDNPFVAKEGALTVTIEPGAITILGEPFPGATHTWHVVRPKTYTHYFVPEGGAEPVGSLETITIVFDNAETASLGSATMINLRAADYSSYHNCSAAESVTVDGHPACRFSFTPAPDKDGEYRLTVNYGAFLLDGAQQTETIDHNFILKKSSGITDITAEGQETLTIVSIDGRVVIRNASADAVKGLDKGFYIINGKKTVVR